MGEKNGLCTSLPNGFEQSRDAGKGVALVVSHTRDGACLCLTQEWHLQRLVICAVPLSEALGEGAEVILLRIAWDTVEVGALHPAEIPA